MKQRRGKESPAHAASSPSNSEGEGVFSVGQYLKSQRTLRGISTEELSLRTRIPRRSLERLEAGLFDGAPDGFVRGFVRTVAEDLGLDPYDTLVRMLPEPNAGQRRSPLVLPPRGWAILVGVAVLVAAIVGITQFALPVAPLLEATSRDEAVIRRDPVRALAEAQAASPALSPVAAPATPHRSLNAPSEARGPATSPSVLATVSAPTGGSESSASPR